VAIGKQILLQVLAGCSAVAAAQVPGGAANGAPAEPLARVEAVQPPAWVLRGGERAPAAPGAALQADDAIETGGGGRVHLAASEGSTIKLGEGGRTQLPELQYVATPQATDQGVYTATLKVLRGAFRFTTRALGHAFQRDVTVDVGPTLTAGIRGTDIWGNRNPGKTCCA
jgi:hypothetical protein